MVINLPIFDLSKEEEEDELLFGTRLLPENMWLVLLALTSSYKLNLKISNTRARSMYTWRQVTSSDRGV